MKRQDDAVDNALRRLAAAPATAAGSRTQSDGVPRANLLDLRTVRFERVRWFEQNTLPRAELTLVNGDGGIGKTTFVLDLIARASAGRPMPTGLRHEKPLRCLILAEEDRHGLLRARLDVARANFDNIRLLESIGDEQEFAVFPTHAETLRRAIEEGGFDFVMIDAFLNHFADDLNSAKPQDMRKVCRPLSTVAHDTGATIVAIRHFCKAAGLASARGLGSIEARNVSRSELAVAPHPDDEAHPGLFVVAISKANLAEDRSATMAYRLVPVGVTDDDGEATTIACVEWEAVPPIITADELTNRPDEGEKLKIDAAADWLSDYLGADEHRASDVCEAGKRAGHSQPTLYRARKKAGVTTENRGYPAKGYWFIKEPLDSQVFPTGEPDKPDKPGDPDESGHEVVDETEETAEALFNYAKERIVERVQPSQVRLL